MELTITIKQELVEELNRQSVENSTTSKQIIEDIISVELLKSLKTKYGKNYKQSRIT